MSKQAFRRPAHSDLRSQLGTLVVSGKKEEAQALVAEALATGKVSERYIQTLGLKVEHVAG